MPRVPRSARAWIAGLRHGIWPWPAPHLRPPRGLRRVQAAESLGAGIDIETQLHEDDDTLRNIVEGLDRLEQRLDRADFVAGAVAHGYFTPNEQDRIHQAMLAYRNYRLGAYEIICRYRNYPAIDAPYLQLRCFLLGYAAALTLIAKSLRIIEWAEHVPLLRAALNAPDAAFELPPGLFDDVLAGFGSLGNYRVMARADWFWRWHRRRLPEYGLTTAEGWREWVLLVRRQRRAVHYRLARVVWARLRYDWRFFWRRLRRPLRKARHGIEGFIAEQGAAAAFVPGFWIHAAIYLRSRQELEALGVPEAPAMASRWRALPLPEHPNGLVLEAMMPRVRIVPVELCLAADHVAVLRPRLSGDQLRAAIGTALTLVGKPYDFEFDFTTDTRVVCTELVYRGYDRRGPVAFELTKRLGRFTLTGDDIMALALGGLVARSSGAAPFDLPILVVSERGQATIVRGPEAPSLCSRIQAGWRPAMAPGAH